MKTICRIVATTMLALSVIPLMAQTVRVVDAESGLPIHESVVTVDGRPLMEDASGVLRLPSMYRAVAARAVGYQRTQVSVNASLSGPALLIRLQPMKVHALYLTEYGIASKSLRGGALAIIKRGGANALVITIKSDRGRLAYPSAIPLARVTGSDKGATIPSLSALVQELHGQGIYLVARIVTFKDDPLAKAHPELAVHASGGRLYQDREHLSWTDPFRREVRDYNIAVAVEAAKAGFDEVQFDYVRFPDCSQKLSFSEEVTRANRVEAITSFLHEAHKTLEPYNVFLSVDVFGYTLWNKNDTGIGQQIEEITPVVDYVCPMLYPSGFQYGIPGHRNPVAADEDLYATIKLSLEEAIGRTQAAPAHFRPWIQGFRDYAFNRRSFEEHEVTLQKNAAEDAKASGWALWNARNVYASSGL